MMLRCLVAQPSMPSSRGTLALVAIPSQTISAIRTGNKSRLAAVWGKASRIAREAVARRIFAVLNTGVLYKPELVVGAGAHFGLLP
jgi:hypothetical protein